MRKMAEILYLLWSVFSGRISCLLDIQPPDLEDRDAQQIEALILQETIVNDLLHHLINRYLWGQMSYT